MSNDLSAMNCGCDRGALHRCERHTKEPLTAPFKWRVILESPLGAPDRAGIERNKKYARLAMRDSLLRGEAPFASHLLYDHREILDDLDAREREVGITAGFEWIGQAEFTVAYVDLGISSGMSRGIAEAERAGRQVEMRTLPLFRFFK